MVEAKKSLSELAVAAVDGLSEGIGRDVAAVAARARGYRAELDEERQAAERQILADYPRRVPMRGVEASPIELISAAMLDQKRSEALKVLKNRLRERPQPNFASVGALTDVAARVTQLRHELRAAISEFTAATGRWTAEAFAYEAALAPYREREASRAAQEQRTEIEGALRDEQRRALLIEQARAMGLKIS